MKAHQGWREFSVSVELLVFLSILLLFPCPKMSPKKLFLVVRNCLSNPTCFFVFFFSALQKTVVTARENNTSVIGNVVFDYKIHIVGLGGCLSQFTDVGN